MAATKVRAIVEATNHYRPGDVSRATLPEDLWVFGYGSLMWRPDFPFVEAVPAHLYGYHRSLCIYSNYHRGTQDFPGLVAGLELGGSCLGRTYRVAADDSAEVIAYLDARELGTEAYYPVAHPVHLNGARGPERIIARCYMVDRSHAQYAGKLPLEEQVRIISKAIGQSGINSDYLHSTVAHLDELGITDGPLHEVSRLIDG